MKNVLIILLVLFSYSACKKKGCTNIYASNYNSKAEKDDCSCIAYVDLMEGTYTITVMTYPKDSKQVGDEFDALVFQDHGGCNSRDATDFNTIMFNNLFTFFGCDVFTLDKYHFEVTLDHNVSWMGAPVSGTGSIINNIFRFDGTVHTSTGDYPIVLEGYKNSEDRRTDAC